MQSRRHLIAIAVIGISLLTAGCADALQGSGSFEYEAQPAEVADSAVSDSGFEHVESDSFDVHHQIEINGNETEFTITNHAATYDKQVGDTNVSFVVVFSTPKMEVGGQALNPIGSMEVESLLDRAVTRRADVKEVESAGSFEARILGEERTVETYNAVAEIDGSEVDVTLQIVRVPHEDDYVIGVGAYPEGYSGKEDVTALFEGIEHPVE